MRTIRRSWHRLVAIPILIGAASGALSAPPGPSHDVVLHDPVFDIASIEGEAYSSFESSVPGLEQATPMGRVMAQASLPLAKVGGVDQFLALRGTYVSRDLDYAGTSLNAHGLHQIWLGAGSMLAAGERHSSFLLLAVSHNGDDFASGSRYLGFEGMYIHTVKIRKNLSVGGGLDVIRYLDQWDPYPLLVVDWHIGGPWKLKVDLDYLELKRFMGKSFAFTSGFRYNLEYYALASGGDYVYKGVGAEAGMQWRIREALHLRVKYKWTVWGEDNISISDGRRFSGLLDEAHSLRFQFAYAP